jgi:Predicted protease with the C-terminal PDZ domain
MNFSVKIHIGAVALFLILAVSTAAQEIGIKIKISARDAVRVEGVVPKGAEISKNWSFVRSYADVADLGERIENFRLFDASGAEISAKKFIAGEYVAESDAFGFVYDLKIAPPEPPTAAAHVSWLADFGGLLMTGDLLPQNLSGRKTRISFELPEGWLVRSSEEPAGENAFSLSNPEKAVFFVGRDLREKTFQVEKTALTLAVAGEWQFSDEEAAQTAQEIFAEHHKIFADSPFRRVRIFLLPFPVQTAFDRWRAETRGSTVTIISAPTAFKSNALNRLHEQLRHEIFHLWLPNGVNLSGSYDWFYEGFTFYQALKTGVRTNQIRFDDFLSVIGRGFDLTEALTRRRDVSLIEASERRWQNSSDLIYAKGTVVAFLCDAVLLRESRGKKNLDAVFREVFQKHRPPAEREDGNEAVLRILKRNAEVAELIEKYVESNAKLDWQNDLNSFGLEAERISGATVLKVVARPNGRQKDLLNELGYNQWRKISPKKSDKK